MMDNKDGNSGLEARLSQKLADGMGSVVSSCADTGPRSIEGTHPNRISVVRNVAAPMKSGRAPSASRSTARETEPFSGRGKVSEAKATMPKGEGKT